jgi:hypothetical protein
VAPEAMRACADMAGRLRKMPHDTESEDASTTGYYTDKLQVGGLLTLHHTTGS